MLDSWFKIDSGLEIDSEVPLFDLPFMAALGYLVMADLKKLRE